MTKMIESKTEVAADTWGDIETAVYAFAALSGVAAGVAADALEVLFEALRPAG